MVHQESAGTYLNAACRWSVTQGLTAFAFPSALARNQEPSPLVEMAVLEAWMTLQTPPPTRAASVVAPASHGADTAPTVLVSPPAEPVGSGAAAAAPDAVAATVAAFEAPAAVADIVCPHGRLSLAVKGLMKRIALVR